MSQAVRVRYGAGGWLGLVRGRCLVALPADASEETASVTWELLAGTPGVERLLATVLSGRLDLTGLPSFAIVAFREGASVHAILRGEVTLRLTATGGGLTELHGTGVATWNERVFRDIDSFELLVEDAVPDVEDLPLESGAVRLGSLAADLGLAGAEPASAAAARETDVDAEAAEATVDADAAEATVDGDPADADVPSEATPEPAPEAAPDAAAEPDADADPDVRSDAAPATDPAPVVDPAPAGEPTSVEEPAAEAESEPGVDPADDSTEVTDQDSTMVPGLGSETGDAGVEDDAPDTPAEAADDAEDPEDAEDVGDQTIASPIAPAGSAPASPIAPAGSAPTGSAPASAAPASAVPGPQELIDSVPWLAAARRSTPAPDPAPVEEDREMVEVPADLNMTVAPETPFEDTEDDAAEEHPLDTSATPDTPDTPDTPAAPDTPGMPDAAVAAEEADDADTVLSPSSPGSASAPADAPASAPMTAPAPGTAAVDDDHDGETVMKSDLDLAGIPAASATPTPAPPPSTGPVVLARQCSTGHANPPTNSTCGICGQSLSGEAQQVRRPSLGRIRMSTGEVVELDRPAVIGRQPQAHRVGSGAMPRMVQVRSPNGDISRSHCEVVLEGWHVQLRDLKATNGTVLIREGQAPRRLGQGESIMVLDGDIADLGDGVSLRFEGLL